MAPRKQPKLKSIEVRFGHQITGAKFKHMRRFSVAPTETADALYERIKSSFQPHVGQNEISVLQFHNGKRIDLTYHGLSHGGLYQLGVGSHQRHGAGNDNEATKKTKKAVQIIIEHWYILDHDQYKILPASIAPPAPLQDNVVQSGASQQEAVLDPYLWPTRFAESLKVLSSKTQGSKGHEEAVQRLSAAVEERLRSADAQKQPRFGIKHLKTQDVVSVLHYYDRIKWEAEREEVTQALQDVSLDVASVAQASPMAGGSAEVEDETEGDPKPVM
jgi:hypothetical protein